MWNFIYANDTEGNAAGGSHEALVQSVLAGRPLRVLFDVSDVNAASHNCAATFVKHGHVFAQISFVVSEWMNEEKDILRFSTGNLAYIMNLSTTGKTHARLHDGARGTYTEGEYRHAVRWFAEE
jgi:hypothetical protein